MSSISRRDFATLTIAAVPVIGMPFISRGSTQKVVVIGGGPGGATAARYLKIASPLLDVVLLEQQDKYVCCFQSNEVIIGERAMESSILSFSTLKKMGINVISNTVVSVDSVSKKIRTIEGQVYNYDCCIVSPGIDFQWDAIVGYDEAVSTVIPHAWKAGYQTSLLKKQLESLEDGGTLIIVAPPNPFRCPPGPYERASLFAYYLKSHGKTKARVIILDPKDDFSKKSLFIQAWTRLYNYGTQDSIIQWVSGSEGGRVEKIDPKTLIVQAEMDEFKADVLNVIPPQKAGSLASLAGLTDTNGWCPVNQRTFESTKQAGIYVVGDACVAGAMPKSAYSANSQAKVAAAAVLSTLSGREPSVPSYLNTCYSVAGLDYGFSVAAVYTFDEMSQEIVGKAEVTAHDASLEMLQREATYAHSWFENIISDSWGEYRVSGKN